MHLLTQSIGYIAFSEFNVDVRRVPCYWKWCVHITAVYPCAAAVRFMYVCEVYHFIGLVVVHQGFPARMVYLYCISCLRYTILLFFFCVPSHARFSVQWVRRSPQSAAVSQPVPKASCGSPPDWAMSGISSHRRWGRIAGCGWGFEDPCGMDICLSGKFSVCGGGRRVDSVQFSV